MGQGVSIHRFWMAGAAAAIACAGMVSGAAAGPQGSGQAPATPEEPLGWGAPSEGLRIGLLPAVPEPVLHYGDVLTFAIHVRNEGIKPAEYKIWSTELPMFTLGTGNRLRLETGIGPVVTLDLAGGQDSIIPGDSYRVRIQRPGDTPPPADAGSQNSPAGVGGAIPPAAALKHDGPTPLPLLPGEYTVECHEPLRVADKDDPNRATTLQARPGVLKFKVVDANAAVDTGPHSGVGGAPAADLIWGEPVGGLQGGLATDRHQADLPAELRTALNLVFYVRNITTRKLTIQYPRYNGTDWMPWVQDEHGQSQNVRATFFTGLIAMGERTLEPGEIADVGHVQLKWAAQAPASNAAEVTPTLIAPPGKYTVSLVDNIRFVDAQNLNIVLIGGPLPIRVPNP